MKYILMIIIIIIIILLLVHRSHIVSDWAEIHSATPLMIIQPHSISQIQDIILSNPTLPISIAGQKFSHGGQTMYDQSIYFDMGKFNRIISLDPINNLLRVESGCTWAQIQDVLDPLNLSIAEMQSYRNFSVGGSISVNCHGRGMKYGTIADTICSLKVMTADANIYQTDLNTYPDLFKAIIGSYGGIALILECVIKVEPNYPIERQIIRTDRSDLIRTINQIKSNPNIVFYNSNIYPKNEDTVVHISWYKTNKPLTNNLKLQPTYSYYWSNMGFEQLVRRFDLFKLIRAKIEPKLLTEKEVVWKNYEMSADTNSLKPLFKWPTTSILQEYFVPVNSIEKFLNDFWLIINQFSVNLINVSLRYVYQTSIPILNYAQTDRIAVVLYLNVGNNTRCLIYAKKWTQLLIDRVILYGGSYYLPYLLFASVDQFRRAYPMYEEFLAVKNKYDPKHRFTNQFISKYFHQRC